MSDTHPVPTQNTRIGFHYFPDSLHYRDSDLDTWLPVLESMGAKWLTLISPDNRAIPESFIKGLIANGIEPVLHLRSNLSALPERSEIEVLLKSYAAWGVRYIALFDRPNMQASWSDESWVNPNLIDHFLDIFIPYAETVRQLGMYPILSPLEPGGNFWDTAFLRTVLEGIKSRGSSDLLDKLVLGAYAWPSNLPLDWGSGGPERWPGSRPYFTPQGEQDQLGFRIFDWYNVHAEAALGFKLPIILMGTGCRIGDQKDTASSPIDEHAHAEQNLKIAKLLAGDAPEDNSTSTTIPENVLAGNFWLLASETDDCTRQQAWFTKDGGVLSITAALQHWWQDHEPIPSQPAVMETGTDPRAKQLRKAIQHYLLLPVYEWGVSEWHLQAAQPYILKHKPTVGFSIDEARQAKVVTVVGGEQSFQPGELETLKQAGCHVRRVSGDGTSIATQLEEM